MASLSALENLGGPRNKAARYKGHAVLQLQGRCEVLSAKFKLGQMSWQRPGLSNPGDTSSAPL